MRLHDEEAQLTLVRCDQPFEALRCRFVRQRFAPHTHDTFSIGVIDAGAAKLRYRGDDVMFSTGDVIALEPLEVHTGEPVDAAGWSYRMLYLPADLMARLGMGGGDAPRFPQPRYVDAELAAQIGALHRLLEHGAEPLEQESALAAVLHLLCARHADRMPVRYRPVTAQRLEAIREYLELHYARSVSLAELAGLAGVTSFHLIRLFRSRFGMPPYAYLELVRVNRARELIQQGASLTDVATRTGFSDQSHMTRRFKRVFGMPPGQYSRSYRTTVPSGGVSAVSSGSGISSMVDVP